MIQIDTAALAKLKQLQQALGSLSVGLRLIAQGDPCLGIKVDMAWTARREEDDVQYQVDDLTLLADRRHWPLLKGCQISLGERLGVEGLNIQVKPGGCSCEKGTCVPATATN